jgi:RNA polymerase sigma-70 factor (sigma-E family)
MGSLPSGLRVRLADGGVVIDEPLGQGSGDDSEFAGFYAGAFDRSARLAYLLTGDLSTAEDIAQEALARLQPRFVTLEHPAAYLRTVVVNLASRARVRRDRERRLRDRLGRPAAEAPRVQELTDVIDALPNRQRTVVILRYYEDLNESEIAVALGCRPGTVKSLASRALATLRRELDDD